LFCEESTMKAISHLALLCCFLLDLLPPAARADDGPVAKNLVEQAEVHGKDTVAWLFSRPKPSAHVPKSGGKAPPTPPPPLVKKPGIAEPVLGKKLGANAVRALDATGPQARSRLKTMVEGGELAKIGRSQELLEVIAKYGDRAANFVWEHKGVLVGGTLLAGFLANPAPYLEGTRILAAEIIRPVAEVPGQVAREVAGKANWTLLLLVIVLIVAAFVSIKLGLWQRLFHRRDVPLVPAGASQEFTSGELTAPRNGDGLTPEARRHATKN
jgi:hypothetical protein